MAVIENTSEMDEVYLPRPRFSQSVVCTTLLSKVAFILLYFMVTWNWVG